VIAEAVPEELELEVRTLRPSRKSMNVFFDVDYTILGNDGSLRPGTRWVFEQLVARGHVVYVWSGQGIRWDDLHRVGLAEFVSGAFEKPLEEFEEGRQRFAIPVKPDFVVDDYPEIVDHYGGLCIKPYTSRRYGDKEILVVPRLVEHSSGLSTADGSP
jgi:hypothetical protein